MKQEIRQYSEAVRRQVVAEYEAGCSLADLREKYNIRGGSTIQKWIAKYASAGLRHTIVRIQSAEDVSRVKQLEQQVKELEQALARTTLEKLKLESMLEVLQEDSDNQPFKKNGVP